MPDSTQVVSAQTVLPAGPGWSLVTLFHGSDPPTRLNDGRWGPKQPNGRYARGDIYDGDAAACIAELVAMELAAIRRRTVGRDQHVMVFQDNAPPAFGCDRQPCPNGIIYPGNIRADGCPRKMKNAVGNCIRAKRARMQFPRAGIFRVNEQ
jgi:hypothetical protein